MSIKDLEPAKLALYYPEEYLVWEDEEVSVKNAHLRLVIYLMSVFEWLYRQEDWFIASEIILHHPLIENSSHTVVPDLNVFKGIDIPVDSRPNFSIWYIGAEHPAPPVIVEISSQSTWPTDIGNGPHDKPDIYGRIGVKEYFAYDPFEPQVWQNFDGLRLLGWRYENGEAQPIEPETQGIHRGRLYSRELASWLEADGLLLRLYDQQGKRRLTGQEADHQARLADQQQVRQEVAARQQAELKATTAQRQAEDAVRARQEAERRALEAEQKATELQRLLEQLQQGNQNGQG